MATLLTEFPDEILVQMFEELDNRDLLKVRSVCRRFSGPASSCFRVITSNVPNDEHWRHAKAEIPETPIARHVRTVRIVPGEALRLPGPDPLDWTVHQYELALEHACKFPALRGICLSLSYFGRIFYEENDESDFEFAAPLKVLRKLFEVARRKTLRELEVEMVPPLHLPITRDPMFKQCMRSVKTLILHFDAWYCDEGWDADDDHVLPDSSLSTRAHEFTRNIGEWIGRSQDVLKVLSLSFENYVGYYPKLDFRNMYYPRLRVLELTCVTISHAAQISWILAHGDTLTAVHLEDCPLVAYTETQQALDDEAYPIPGEDFPDSVSSWNDLFWHDIFDSFRIYLTHLRDFSITLTWMDPEISHRVSGMMPQRYKSYHQGELISNDSSRKVAEEHHQADIDAYVRLLHHTEQLGKLLFDMVTSGTYVDDLTKAWPGFPTVAEVFEAKGDAVISGTEVDSIPSAMPGFPSVAKVHKAEASPKRRASF
ncbi:hypothetical protein BU25DRAFT_446942 [Macroventuria anomochaeta]|uniref:Uncharacterized protein n=1 Tax=Macroventuria anomochaeta TaxID=301207 RepID=A0ACB6SAL6_9PLEO|nr:uncharacterized protein BU25DRAFT_446942 [Macroventuria anomochaeta]KAF2630142.1 hypothetical protein BU25DRAFT_446942 [Macroventuria anomochaeta]